MKKQIFLGKVTAKESKNNNTYYKGFVGNVPVVGFPKTDGDGNETINFSLDVSTAQWITEQDVDGDERKSGGRNSSNKKTESSQKPTQQENVTEEDEDDVPF